MADKKDDKKKPEAAAAEEGAPKKKNKLVMFIMIFVAAIVLIGGSVAGTLYFTGFFAAKHAPAEGEEGEASAEHGGEHGAADKGHDAKAEDHGGGHGGGHDEGKSKESKPLPKDEKFAATYKTIDRDFTMNVPHSRKYVQFKVAYKTFFGEQIVERVTKHQVAVEAAILAAASQYGEEEMTSVDGRIRLATSLRDAMNDVLIRNEDFGGVDEVMFTNFVFQ